MLTCDFYLVVPGDCVASNTLEENKYGLEQMQKVLKADTRPAADLSFDDLKNPGSHEQKPQV